jgi:hypothetical protein
LVAELRNKHRSFVIWRLKNKGQIILILFAIGTKLRLMKHPMCVCLRDRRNNHTIRAYEVSIRLYVGKIKSIFYISRSTIPTHESSDLLLFVHSTVNDCFL